jgi:hypothetical protein
MFMSKKPILILTALASLTIALTAQAAPPSTPVVVTNSTANPVPIIGTIGNAENPARSAVQQQVSITLTGTGLVTGSASVPIPAGKIFVLEFVAYSLSFGNNATTGGGIQGLSISVNGPHIDGSTGPLEYQLLIPSDVASRAGGAFPFVNNDAVIFNGSQLLRLYAQPGTTIIVRFTAATPDPSILASASVSLSGYFVNQ